MVKTKFLYGFDAGEVFDFGTVTIGGDKFLLTIPTIKMWESFQKVFDGYCPEWDKHWRHGKTQRFLCQDTSNKNPHLLRFWAELSNSDKAVPYGDFFSPAKEDCTTGFVPALIPLDNKTLEYDAFACLPHTDGLKTDGGGFFINGEQRLIRPITDSYIQLGYDNGDLRCFSIKDAVDESNLIPWIQVAGGYMGAACLASGLSLNYIWYLFQQKEKTKEDIIDEWLSSRNQQN